MSPDRGPYLHVWPARVVAVTLVVVLGLAVLTSGEPVPPVQAQATRTWVSGVGDDANPCSRTAPCKTFQGALSKTAARGEISVLDPGNFGSVTIAKSISLVSDSVTAGVRMTAGTGITVNAGAGDVVVIRGLDIQGTGTATTGILFEAGRALFVEQTQIGGFTGDGILANLTTSGEVHVTGSQLRNNGGAGLRASTASGLLTLAVEGSQLANNAVGLDARDNTSTTVIGSMVASNTSVGLQAQADTTSAALAVADTVVTFNPIGIQVGGGAGNRPGSLSLVRSDIFDNDTGVATGAGISSASSGDNRVAGNTGGNAPFPTFTPTPTPTATLTPTLTPTVTVTSSPTATLTPTVTATATPVACDPRPALDVQVVQTGPGQLQVTVTARQAPGLATNVLHLIRFSPTSNATLTLPGGPTDSVGNVTITLPPNATSYVFTVRRVAEGAFRAPFTAVDSCGDWPTFVGGGAGVN